MACFVILNGYGDGFHRAMLKAFRSQGQDLVLVFGGRTSSQAGGERAGRRIVLERSGRGGDPRSRSHDRGASRPR